MPTLTPPREHALGVTAMLSVVSAGALGAAWLIAGVILAFWFIPPLADLAPDGWMNMSGLTAEGLLLAAGSLTLTGQDASPLAIVTAKVAAAGVVVIGLATFLDGLGIAHLAATHLPSPQTASAFVLLGAMLLLMQARRLPAVIAELVLLAYSAFTLFMVGGYAFNAVSMVEAGDGRLIAPQTLICLICLGTVIAIRLANAGAALLELFVMSGLGSRILRYMTLPILFVPFILFTLVGYFYEAHILPPNVTRAVFAPVIVIGVFGLVGWMAASINRLQSELVMQSTTDELTGVLNRRGFISVSNYVVKAAERAGTNLVVLFFDLDGLKTVNDTLGHEAGSDLLKRFARLLKDTFRRSDIIARIGGDEFAVLTTLDRDEIRSVTLRIGEAARADNAVSNAKVSYSVGFAPLERGADNALEEAMAVADGFMYQQKRAKESGAQQHSADAPAPGAHAEGHI